MKTIEQLIKGGILTEIEIDKVSLVKSPANQRRFVFTKQANIEGSFSTDQTFDGTAITVNGEELEDLDSFHFSLVNWSDEDIEEWGASPVSMSFTTKKSSEGGLDVVETFSLHSEVQKTMKKSDVLKAMKENLGIELDEAGFDKLAIEKQKALEGLAVFSPALNGQPAFREAVTVFVKSGTEAEPEAEVEEDRDADTKDTDETAEALATAANIERDAKIKLLEDKLAELSKPAEEPDDTDTNAGDDAAGDDTASEPVTKADLAAFGKQLKVIGDRQLAIAKAAGVKQSDEIDIEKRDSVKDEWGWGGAKLDE